METIRTDTKAFERWTIVHLQSMLIRRIVRGWSRFVLFPEGLPCPFFRKYSKKKTNAESKLKRRKYKWEWQNTHSSSSSSSSRRLIVSLVSLVLHCTQKDTRIDCRQRRGVVLLMTLRRTTVAEMTPRSSTLRARAFS